MGLEAAVDNALDLQWKLGEKADARKGRQRLPHHHQTRSELLQYFTPSNAQSRNAQSDTRFTIISEPYAPSVIPLQQLNKIHLRDLLLDTRHEDSLLVLRTFGYPVNPSDFETIMPVEDESGDVDRVSVFNFGLATWPEKQLPSGVVLAIKEPFYRSVAEDMGMAICVNHPSDVIFLEMDHHMYPATWQSAPIVKTAAEWKLDGNEALKNKDFIKANYCYGKGIASPGQVDSSIHDDLFRNRAQAGLFLGRFEAAKEDAMRSISGADHDKSKDAKSFYRAGRAEYELFNYQEAQKLFQKVLELSPSDKDSRRELKRTMLRLKEEQNGAIELTAMAKCVDSSDDIHVDPTGYIRRTEIRQTEHHGRGLFTTQAIDSGELIFCEKAFIASNTPANVAALGIIINPALTLPMSGSHVAIWIAGVQKIFNNPSLGNCLLGLHNGKSSPSTGLLADMDSSPSMVDGMPIIDVFHFQEIIENNSFGFNTGKNPVDADVKKKIKADSSGVWRHASYMNHSCLFNASRSFIGDFIVVRANKDIAKGEEITTMYRPTDGDFEQFQRDAEDWGFCCDCKLCEAEKKREDSRSSITFEVNSFLMTDPVEKISRLAALNAMPAALIDEAKKLRKEMIKTYPLQHFITRVPHTRKIIALLPMMGLAGLDLWLLVAHYNNPPRALDYAIFVLQDHGYVVTINKTDGIAIDRTNCVLSDKAVFAMQYIEHFYTKTGAEQIARTARVLAEELYVTSHGSMFKYKGIVD